MARDSRFERFVFLYGEWIEFFFNRYYDIYARYHTFGVRSARVFLFSFFSLFEDESYSYNTYVRVQYTFSRSQCNSYIIIIRIRACFTPASESLQQRELWQRTRPSARRVRRVRERY